MSTLSTDIKEFFADRALNDSRQIVKYRERLAFEKHYCQKVSTDRLLAFYEGKMIEHANLIIRGNSP